MKNLKRNIKVGKIKTFLLIVFLFSQLFTLSHSNEFNVQGNFLEIKVLDKVSPFVLYRAKMNLNPL